jgi:puromycin-sensitive aminopeptidase
VLRALLMSVFAQDRTWGFIKANWERMNRDYPTTGVRRMFEGVIGLATPEHEADVRDFFARHRIELGGKTLGQYLEQLHIAVRLRQREAAALHAYLARMS